MSTCIVHLSRKPQCSVTTHMRVPIFQKVANFGEFTSMDGIPPSPFFEIFVCLFVFFWLEQIVRRWMDSLYVIFSQYRPCDTTLGLRS